MNPSLLLIPDRYKAAKLYSQIPDSGAGDLDFARASVATRVNASGLIESVASGVPRLDYTGGGCPSLLLEPQRTNLYLYSDDFSEVNWAKSDSSATANSIISPDGTVNAWKLNDNTNNAQHALFRGVAGVTSPTAISFFVKAAEYTRCCIENYSDGGRVVFNIANKTIISTSANFTNATIEQYANGFIRISAITVGTTGNKAIGLGLVNDLGQDSFVGTGTNGIFVYGAQLEVGSYPTSYIPTLGSSVTRLADVASKGSISSLVNNTEGTLYFEVLFDKLYDAGGAGPSGLEIGDGGNFANIISIGVVRSAQNVIRAINRSSSSNVFVNVFNVNTVGKYKCAFSYGATGNSFYVNGALVSNYTTGSSSTAAIVNSFSRLTLGGYWDGSTALAQNNDGTISAAIYPTRLSNAELAQLTTL